MKRFLLRRMAGNTIYLTIVKATSEMTARHTAGIHWDKADCVELK